MNQPDLFPLKPEREMVRAAEVSDCGRYRWTLTRAWDDGDRLLWCMLNPSTADDAVDDPTARQVVHFSKLWGYGSAIVVNLYPFRTSSPAACQRLAFGSGPGDLEVWEAMAKNIGVITREAQRAAAHVVAWGNEAWDAKHIARAVLALTADWSPPAPPALYCLGTTQSGAPKHPMARGVHRVPLNQQPVEWRTPQ